MAIFVKAQITMTALLWLLFLCAVVQGWDLCYYDYLGNPMMRFIDDTHTQGEVQLTHPDLSCNLVMRVLEGHGVKVRLSGKIADRDVVRGTSMGVEFFVFSNEFDYTTTLQLPDNIFRLAYVYGGQHLSIPRSFTFSWQMVPLDRSTSNPSPCFPSHSAIDVSSEPRGWLSSNAKVPKYGPNSVCAWEFVNPYGAAVHLGVSGMTQRDDDFVVIVDSETSKKYKYSYKINAELIVQGDFKVSFTSDAAIQYEGFNMTWFADMAVEEIRTSPKVITQYELAITNYTHLGEPLNGTFSRAVPLVALKNPAPCYPAQRVVDLGVSPAGFVASSLEGLYVVGGACSWQFVSVPSPVVLFLSGELNDDDLVNITFGSQSLSFSGVLNDNVQIPMVDSFTVRFRSYNSTQKPGFTLDWQCAWLDESTSYSAPTEPTTSSFGLYYGAIAGIVVGSLLLTALVVGLIVFFCVKATPSDQGGVYEKMPTD